MTWTVATRVAAYLIAAGVAFLLARAVWREWREGYEKDQKEKHPKYIRGLFIQYGIIFALCVAAYVGLRFAKNTAFISNLSRSLYGGSVPTSAPATPTINPFFKR